MLNIFNQFIIFPLYMAPLFLMNHLETEVDIELVFVGQQCFQHWNPQSILNVYQNQKQRRLARVDYQGQSVM